MARESLKYIQTKTGADGATRLFFRKRGEKKVELRGPVGSMEFLEDYTAAIEGKLRPNGSAKRRAEPIWVKAATVGALIKRYTSNSPEWRGYSARMHYKRGLIYDAILSDMGYVEYAAVKPSDIRRVMEQFGPRYGTANEYLKAFRCLFDYACKIEDLEINPAKHVSYAAGTNPEGFHCWTEDQCLKFEDYYPVGSTPRLVFALGIYTAQRRSDLVRLGDAMRRTDRALLSVFSR